MNSTHPKANVSRQFEKGRFCLQEYIPAKSNARYTTSYCGVKHQRSGLTYNRKYISCTMASHGEEKIKGNIEATQSQQEILKQSTIDALVYITSSMKNKYYVESIELHWIFADMKLRNREIGIPYLIGSDTITLQSVDGCDVRVDPESKDSKECSGARDNNGNLSCILDIHRCY